MRRPQRYLQAALLALCATPAWAVVSSNDITGEMVMSDSNCPGPVPLFNQDDCSYDASDPTGFGSAEWIGPVFNAGYYAPGTSPGPAAAGVNDPVPGDGKTPPAITGSLDIDDQDTPAATDDTLTASIVIGQTVRNFGAGARGTGEETWTSLTMVFGPVAVSSATANGAGGFDYVLGSRGMPPRLVDAATGTDFWPSETGADSDSAVGVGHYWAGPSPIGIAPIEANVSLGTTASFTATGYSCVDILDGIGGAASACDARGLLGDGVTVGGRDFENVILALSTDAAGDITAATLIWVQQQDVVTPSGPDSWVAGLIAFTGTCSNCDPPGVAQNDGYSVDQDSVGNILDIGANDAGFDTPSTATISVAPNRGGSATIQNSPGNPTAITVSYTPAVGFSGTETFQYTMTDGDGSDTAVVTILVLTSDANDDVATTRLNTPVTILVGANDQGFADPATVTISAAPDQGGSATVSNSPGPPGAIAIQFTPAAPLNTPTYVESFEYTITDGLVTGTATVSVSVTNQVPVAPDRTVTTGEGAAAAINVASLPGAVLGDAPRTVVVSAPPANGGTTVSGTTITYTPTGFFTGSDAFDYTLTDADGETSSGTITVNVGPARVPEAEDDLVNVVEGQSLEIDVAANDRLGSGDLASHTITITRQPDIGSVSVTAGNRVMYVAAPGSFGSNDDFEYTLRDANLDVSAPATVQVGIAADRPPPAAEGVSANGLLGLLLLAALLARRNIARRPSAWPDVAGACRAYVKQPIAAARAARIVGNDSAGHERLAAGHEPHGCRLRPRGDRDATADRPESSGGDDVRVTDAKTSDA
jgi:hypothetical protein